MIPTKEKKQKKDGSITDVLRSSGIGIKEGRDEIQELQALIGKMAGPARNERSMSAHQ